MIAENIHYFGLSCAVNRFIAQLGKPVQIDISVNSTTFKSKNHQKLQDLNDTINAMLRPGQEQTIQKDDIMGHTYWTITILTPIVISSTDKRWMDYHNALHKFSENDVSTGTNYTVRY